MRTSLKPLAALTLLLLASTAFGQADPAATDSVSVSIAWSVPDRISAEGNVTITFDTETDTGYSASIAGSHILSYANNQTIDRRITIQAVGSIPSGLSLTANAAPNVGSGAAAIEVGPNPRNLVTGIPSGTTNGSATVTFGAESTGPIEDNQEITIKYTITAG